jgi:Membrane proteins related to metalloendopeptidases
MAGTVDYIGYDTDGYGNYCIVTSSDGKKEVLYAHLQSVAVSPGQSLNKGEIIGYVGNTGVSTGAHLHIEYSIDDGFNTNPAFFLEGACYTGIGSDDIVAVAAAQLGNYNGQLYWSWYGFTTRVEWCATFVSWCAEQCGYIDAGIILKYAYCPFGASWFQTRGLWQTGGGSYTPIAGDIIFFDWEMDGEIDHTGIVENSDGSIVYTIEGNTGNSVKRITYSIYSGVIAGYGTPAY